MQPSMQGENAGNRCANSLHSMQKTGRRCNQTPKEKKDLGGAVKYFPPIMKKKSCNIS